MGNFNLKSQTKCQEREEEKENHPHPDQSADLPELDFNSQSEESPDILDNEDTPKELELEPQFISPPSLNTSPPRSSSSQVTPPEITEDQESSQYTSNLLSETTRNSPDS